MRLHTPNQLDTRIGNWRILGKGARFVGIGRAAARFHARCGSSTHLVSAAMAAAVVMAGRVVDVREWE